jgi:hypothetical protein
MLSSEQDDSEINWSRGTYTKPAEVWSGFGLVGGPPAPEGVAPHQPSPYQGQVKAAWSIAFLAMGALIFIYLALALAGGKVVHKQSVAFEPKVASGSPEAAVFTDRFFVQSDGNVEVQVRSNVSNSWLYLDGALINEETGGVDEFDLETSYYFGADSDGAWTEGSTDARTYVAAVPAGRYVMRLGPQWEAGRVPPSFDLRVRSRVPRLYQLVLALLALMAWPLIVGWRSWRFEAQRWSESDHAWTASGESGDSDDDDSGGDD